MIRPLRVPPSSGWSWFSDSPLRKQKFGVHGDEAIMGLISLPASSLQVAGMGKKAESLTHTRALTKVQSLLLGSMHPNMYLGTSTQLLGAALQSQFNPKVKSQRCLGLLALFLMPQQVFFPLGCVSPGDFGMSQPAPDVP